MTQLTYTYKHTATNPNMPDPSMDHWLVTLRHDGRSMTIHFSKGRGHNGAAPTLTEVMDCLASDCACLGSFEDWCWEFGYDPDSRKAEQAYRTIVKQEAALRRLLGDEFDAVLNAQFVDA